MDSYLARIQAEKKNQLLFKQQQDVEDYLIRIGDLANVNIDEGFVYTSGKKKKNAGFFLDDTLKRNLDNFLITAVDAKWDSVLILSGMEGCLEGSSNVLMASGEWKNIKDIKTGDLIMSPQFDGSYKYAKVLNTNKWFSRKMYDVHEATRSKQKLFSCSSNHGLPININGNIKAVEADTFNKLGRPTKLRKSLVTSFPIYRYNGKLNCKVEPYTLGAFIGDGSYIKSSLQITGSHKDIELLKEVESFYKPMSIKEDTRNKNTVLSYYYSMKSKLCSLLDKYDLHDKRSKDKFIPKEALTSDIKYRSRLLSGLIDSDGTYYKGTYSIKTKSKQLSEDIKNLVYSLGGRARINTDDWAIKNIKNGNRYYRVSMYLPDGILETKVKRKISKNIIQYIPNQVKIETKESNGQMVYGFELDSESHLFVTDNWCLSFNSGKTIFASTICKYVDPTFPGPLIDESKSPRRRPERIVFSPQDFYNAVDTAKPKQAIQFDEAILGLMAGDAGMSIQKMLMKKITLIRKKQLYIILVIPSIFSVRMPIAVQRSRYLIHTFSPDGITRGRFKFYNYPRKRNLYIKGKRDYNQDSVEPSFIGSFVNTNGLFYDEDEYDKKKEYAIQHMMDDKGGKKAGPKANKLYIKTAAQRNLLLLYFKNLIEGGHESKEKMQKLIEYHSLYSNAKKTTDMLNTPKFSKILSEVFGDHLKINSRSLLEYLKKGETYLASKGALLDEEEDETSEKGSKEEPKESD